MLIMFLITAGYALLGELFFPDERLDSKYKCEIYTSGWTQVLPDGTEIPIEIPGSCDAKKNEIVRIKSTLPQNLEHDSVLWLWSLRQDMRIYVDGVLREEYTTKDTRYFGKTSSSAYIFVELTPEDEGKTVLVESQSDSNYTGVFRDIYFGNKTSILRMLFRQYGVELVVGFMLIFFSTVCIIMSICLKIFYHREIALEYLAWGILTAAFWLINNSIFRQIIFKNISTSSDITFFCVMLLPLPFLLYMNKIQNGRYENGYLVFGVIAALDTAICILLQAFNIKDYSETIVYTCVICGCSVVFLGITMIIDIWRGYIKEYRLIAMGIVGACVAVLVQFFLYFQKADVPFSGVAMAAGLIFLLVSAAVSAVREIVQVERERKKAILANESKARFLANMSHEIRTPINAVLGMDEMILRETKEEHIREYAKDIQNAGRSLLSLINDILDFSKIESGRLEIIPVAYEVSSVLNDCYNMIHTRAKEKGLRLHLVNNESIPKRLKGDEVRIRQIITNLLTNAVKYTREGEITLAVDGTRLEGNKLLLTISVKDTGIGIKEENQKKLFDSFQRIEEKKNRNIEGNGLGLSITKQLLDLMEGEISVESVYGKGSVFTVKLPQEILSEEVLGNIAARYEEAEEKKKRQTRQFEAPGAQILVVDDVTINLKVFKGLLKETSVQIDAVDSGKQCLSMIKQKKYDIIFLDHMMPELDGIETFKQMKKQMENKNKETPVIMLTANAILGAREEYLNVGFQDYLAKPFHQDDLEAIVLKYLPDRLICWKQMGEKTEETEESETLKQTLLERLSFLDTAQGLSYSMNNEGFYLEVLKTYLANRNDDLLEELYEKQDWENYRVQVHTIKSSSLYIGANSFSEKAKDLEAAAKVKAVSYIKEQHTTFMKEYKLLLNRLEEAIKGE